jgi:signal transduction histidine kinase
MKSKKNKIIDSITKYRFEFRHLVILFVTLIFFQMVISYIHRVSLRNFLVKTQDWYQQDSAERLANLTATSLELILENTPKNRSNEIERKTIEAFNIILSQQLLQHNVQEVCILISQDTGIFAINDGNALYSYFFGNTYFNKEIQEHYKEAISLYEKVKNEITEKEHIKTIIENKQTFHIFVPFVPRGEYLGAIYMKNTPDFSSITQEIISGFNESNILYSFLILIIFFAMLYISTLTIRERDITQQRLFEEHKKNLEEHINHQKEIVFTKRIYHAHHKAEKIIGFIKEDLRQLTEKNIDDIKRRVKRYANFIARVIYDMKWFDPPIQTIRSPIFKTDLNEVLKFLIENVFLRVTNRENMVQFKYDLDEKIPLVNVNEYIAWEIFEPIIQNSIDHGGDNLIVTVKTKYDPETNHSIVEIRDNGKGIIPGLLEKNEQGIKKIFQEKISTKDVNSQHSGYGCFLAFEISTQRCGWSMEVENLPEGGCKIVFIIPN